MKKILLVIIMIFMTASYTYAYESVNAGYIVMQTGLSGLSVQPVTDDGWETYYIEIKGEDLAYLESYNADITRISDFEAELRPKNDYLAEKNSYALWEVHGRYLDQFFFLGGISIEGEILHNTILPHGFGLFFFFLAFMLALMVWQINRGERCI